MFIVLKSHGNVYIYKDSKFFLTETLSCGVLDSGCTKTESWLQCYVESLADSERSKIKTLPTDASFKFGSGESFPSLKKVVLPAQIGYTIVKLETEVVEANIPLLLSKISMKAAKTVLNFGKDTVTMFGYEQPLLFTSSGHYSIPI